MTSASASNNTLHRIARFAVATAALLSIPLVAMQFTAEVAWTPFDFAVAGFLLFGSALVYVLSTRNVSSTKSRIIIGAAVAVVLLVVWAELAVGIIGTPFAGS